MKLVLEGIDPETLFDHLLSSTNTAQQEARASQNGSPEAPKSPIVINSLTDRISTALKRRVANATKD